MQGLERWEYGDPESVAIRREEKSCKGCHSIEVVKLFGETQEICDDGRPKERRCRKYKLATIRIP